MTITIPENLSEITLDQFIKYNRVLNIPDLDDERKMIFIVALFCNIDVSKIGILEIVKVKEIANKIVDVLNSKPREIIEFKLNNELFGFIPNFDTITSSEYIDLDLYINQIETANKAMSVLFRPIIKKVSGSYLIEKYEGSDKFSEEMLKAPLEAYLSAKVFFWNLSKALLKTTKVYLSDQTTEIIQLDQALQKNGSGMIQFIQLLTEMSLILEKQLSYQYTNF